ncbi:hypothetical protein ACIPY0_20225 [Paenarthrobacter nicotinovorans]|uniref:hypothetical protein n=1 Tax=Paenarthrobacter nicotinovorans TaxID=29320 RepID=UPI0038299398
MVVVTPDDVAAGWRPLTDAEDTTAEGLIAEALVLLAVKAPAFESFPEALARLAVARAVRRVLKNPDGYRVRGSESIDDYSYSGGTIDTTLSSGEIYFSAEELSWFGVKAEDEPRSYEIRLGSP